MKISKKIHDRQARRRRTRATVRGTSERPRMSVHRSLLQMTVQIIDDESGKTIAASSTKELKAKPNLEGAKNLGEAIAKKAKEAKVSRVVFDRNGYKYHGRMKELADAARTAGLTF
jgi:large subunit ribosomal protein L18